MPKRKTLKPPKPYDPSVLERPQQRAVVKFARDMGLPIFAIPNGGSRRDGEGAALRLDGVVSGVPDLFIPKPTRTGYPGMFIEMKRGDGEGEESANQRRWREGLTANGYLSLLGQGGAGGVIDALLVHYTFSPLPEWYAAIITKEDGQ